jgi:signal transduction histidine kinase
LNLFFFVFVFVPISHLNSQSPEIDSLKKVVNEESEDISKSKALDRLAQAYIDIFDYTSALPFAEKNLQLAKKLSFKRGIALAHRKLAIIYGYFGLYGKSFENTLLELKVCEELKDFELIIQAYSDLAFEYTLQKDFIRALQTNQKILKIREERGQKDNISTALWNVGRSYLNLCQLMLEKVNSVIANEYYNKTIECYTRALNINKELNNNQNVAFFLNSLAYVYDKLNLFQDSNNINKMSMISGNYFDRVVNTYSAALQIYDKEKNDLGKVDYFSGIGLFYRNQGNLFSIKHSLKEAFYNYQRSLSNYLEAYKILKRLGFSHGIANYSKEVGLSYLKLQDFKKAEPYIDFAATGFEKRRFIEGAKDSYQILSEINFQLGNYNKSLKYFKKYSALKDSMLNIETMKKLTELKIRFETERKEDENRILRAENTREKAIQLISILIGVILVFTIIFLVNNYKAKIKTEKIQQQYNLIAQTNEVRQKISNDLHDQIGSGLTSISMMCLRGINRADNIIANKDLFNNIKAKSQELSESLGELIWATNPENDNLSNLIANIRNYTYNYLESFGITPKVNLTDSLANCVINSEAHRNIYLILKEALHNIVKHSEARNVEVEMFVDDRKNFKLTISDDGKGFDTKMFCDRTGRKSLEKRTKALTRSNLILKSEPGKGTQLIIEGSLAG